MKFLEPTLSSYMNPGSKSWPARVATSPAFLGRSIGRADGPDRASRGLFSKKTSSFSRINPQYRPPLRFFFKKALELCSPSPASHLHLALPFLSLSLPFPPDAAAGARRRRPCRRCAGASGARRWRRALGAAPPGRGVGAAGLGSPARAATRKPPAQVPCAAGHRRISLQPAS